MVFGIGGNGKESSHSLNSHSNSNKRKILEGALNPRFKRKIHRLEAPALKDKIKKLQSELNEFTPIENSLVSKALYALEKGNLDEPILQRYID